MNEEITNIEKEDFNIDELLNEEEDSPIDADMTEDPSASATKKISKKNKKTTITDKQDTPEVPAEVTEVNKELSNMEWQPFAQPAYEGFQNMKTGEVIDEKEVLRRTLCFAQEAARNSR